MNFDALIKKATAGGVPTLVLAGVGILLLLITFRAGKTLLKFILFVVALALLAGAVWWHFQKQH